MTVRVRAADDEPHVAVVRFVDLLRIRVFAILYGAQLLSTIGDQLARVALAVLVFDSTGSSAITALTYATTFLPAVCGGIVLARIGDRLSRPRSWSAATSSEPPPSPP